MRGKLIIATVTALTATARAEAADPALGIALSSNERVGLMVSGDDPNVSASAALGLWSDRGALELGGFQDRADSTVAQTAEITSGKLMRSRGVRLGASLYRGGWTLGLEARREQAANIGSALTGAWRTDNDSRLTLGGKLKF